ncbi:MAG: M48 family metalloprotease [Elusimicrobia bacterium]|nr:M48 family metalloprotease [Elusimicrobiota bacterium]
MKRISLSTKTVAALLSTALLITAPGLGCYEALAQVVTGSAVSGASAIGGQSAAAAGAVAGRAVTPSVSLTLPVGIGLSPVTAAPAAITVGGVTPVGLPVPAARGELGAVSPAAQQLPSTQALPQKGGENTAANLAVARQSQPAAAIEKKLDAPVQALLTAPGKIAPASADIGKMAGGEAHAAGSTLMDRVSPVAGRMGTAGNGLVPTNGSDVSPASYRVPAAPAQTPVTQSKWSAIGRVAVSMATVAGAALAVVAVQAAAVALAPAAFGIIPGAALWAVMSGVVLGPVALYFRYRFSLRDSERLSGPKRVFDIGLGLLAGAAIVALPGILTGAILSAPAVALPAAIVSMGSLMAMAGGETHLKSGLLAAGSTALLAVAAVAGPLTIGSIFGLMAIPALTTLSFFAGRIIESAETGRPFSIPGSTQAIRFPLYTWVMTGVVFALLTGFVPVWTNVAFGAWMFLGSKKYFNHLYLSVAGLAVLANVAAFALPHLAAIALIVPVVAKLAQFASPLAFFALAFLPERAAVWTEGLLGRMLQRGAAAPSSAEPTKVDGTSAKPAAWPKYHYALRTGIFIATLLGLAAFIGLSITGVGTILTNTAVAGAIVGLQLAFSVKLIKMMMKVQPTTEESNPEVWSIMKDLRERINKERAAKGQKPIPMPEIVDVPVEAMPVPNAFATGLSPFKALVGVTVIFKGMVLDPENLRANLSNVLRSVDPQGKAFKIYRIAIAGSIPGISADAAPEAVRQAVQGATQAQLKELGYRIMRGVLGHEFTHVMHRDMILGGIASGQSSGISFASYGVLWAVGHAKALAHKVWEMIRSRAAAGDAQNSKVSVVDDGTRNLGRAQPQMLEPVSTGLAVKTLVGLVKVFAALWAPIIAQLLQLASSRAREGHADEGGALLTEDPASLALGLGVLMSWRPPSGFQIDRRRLPFMAATQHLFTVNPGEQLLNGGVLEAKGTNEGRPVEKADNAFFNAFITHPDTGLRIDRLYEMTMAQQQKQKAGGGTQQTEGTRNLGL